MGTLEKSLKREVRLGKIQKIILSLVATAGLLSVAMVMPNALQALRLFGGKDLFKRSQKESINYSRRRLVQLGLLEYDKNHYLQLTVKGRRELYKAEAKSYKIINPRIWDKKWRVIIFDIPHKHRIKREALRGKLKELGFAQLQKSVWVHPYECEAEIKILKDFFGLSDKDLQILLVEKIEDDYKIRQKYKL